MIKIGMKREEIHKIDSGDLSGNGFPSHMKQFFPRELFSLSHLSAVCCFTFSGQKLPLQSQFLQISAWKLQVTAFSAIPNNLILLPI